MIIVYMPCSARRVKYVIFQQVIFLFCQLSRLIHNLQNMHNIDNHHHSCVIIIINNKFRA